jgi:catechol 2,3-dioxygenase-like lactoylglutathione lyase family enzyme
MARYWRAWVCNEGEDLMLDEADAAATVAVTDLDRAKKFYEETLGLKPERRQEPGTLAYKTAGARLFVYPSSFAGTNKATVVTWTVDDAEATAAALKARGVVFEHYDGLPETTRKGDVHFARSLKIAWFKDPDGNIHSVVSRS